MKIKSISENYSDSAIDYLSSISSTFVMFRKIGSTVEYLDQYGNTTEDNGEVTLSLDEVRNLLGKSRIKRSNLLGNSNFVKTADGIRFKKVIDNPLYNPNSYYDNVKKITIWYIVRAV